MIVYKCIVLFPMETFIRRIALGVVVLATSVVSIYAQSSSSRSVSISWSGSDNSAYERLVSRPHEVKLNLLSTALLFHPEIAYDYTLNPDISFGGRMAYSFDVVGVPNSQMGKFTLSPYARWHFYKESRGNSLRGFFVEANLAYNYYDSSLMLKSIYVNGEPVALEEGQKGGVSAFGLGVGLGYRWVTTRDWTFELGCILGRNIVHSDPVSIYGNFVFSIGKRF